MASVTRKRQGSRAARRDDLRRRLLEIVERLLDEGESYADVSVERLVSEAGVSRSTFYVYFEDKADLLRGWFNDIVAELEAAAADWWTIGEGATQADLRGALEKVVKTYQPHTTLMAATYDAADADPEVRELVKAMMDGNAAGLSKHIRTGQAQGSIDPDLLPTQTAAWLTWMAERGLHQLVRTAGQAEVERLIDAYAAIIWNALYAPAVTSPGRARRAA